MKAYLDIIRKILDNGVRKENRTGMDAISIAGAMFEHDMEDGFPLLTTKQVPFRLISSELEFFVQGRTDKRWLQDHNNHIWDEWCNPMQAPQFRSNEERLDWQKENPDLGPLGYSYEWRHWGAEYKPIPFIWTGMDRKIEIQPSSEPLVGKTIRGRYGEFTVVAYDDCNKYFTVKFRKTGFTENNVSVQQIEDGTVQDPYFPEICGVACLGNYDTEVPQEIIDRLKIIWCQIIHRCYDPEHPSYTKYEARNVYVSNNWLIFANFLRDVQNLDGWHNKVEHWDSYCLNRNNNCYSKTSCSWIEENECTEEGLLRKTKSVGIDQLSNLINILKIDPNSRRMIVSAWNPEVINAMALPPYHYTFQVTVIGNKLNLLWNQRSVDSVLGLPYNIACYGLLLHLLAKQFGFQEGRLIGFLADTHVYVNHLDGIEEQLKREPLPLPRLVTEPFTDIFTWEYKHSRLNGYQHHPKIPFKVAV
jgi:thymidylate synthase